MRIYAEIKKIDEEQRLVYGYASTEALDSQGERVRKEALEAALPDYMKFANLREMHQPSAVGVAQEAVLDDKGLYLVGKVVDDSAWNKVKEGVYKGFSLGGKKIVMVDNEITQLKLTEISLVDRPANPETVFDLWKAEGDPPAATEEPAGAELQKRINDVGQMARVLYEFRCLLASVVYEAQEEKDGSLVPGRLRQAFVNLVKIFKEFAAEEADELLAGVQNILEGAQPMMMAEGAGSQAGTPALLKAGARHTAQEMQQIQIIHDHAAALGAACQTGGEKMEKAELKKLAEDQERIAKLEADFTAQGEQLAKVEADFTAQGEQLAKVEADKAVLEKRVQELEKEPQAPKGALKAVPKGDDAQSLAKAEEPTQEELLAKGDTLALIKQSHQNPKFIRV